jgi:hypothetical protein
MKKKKWIYERGEGRFKHCWGNPFAGFVPSVRGAIGKCSSKITDEVAQALLDTGLPFVDFEEDDEDSFPGKIFNLHEGVVYEAVPTNPGQAYHGYPWRGNRPPLRIIEGLENIAKKNGQELELKKWLKANTR